MPTTSDTDLGATGGHNFSVKASNTQLQSNTVSATKSSATKACPLLDLPPELRNAIYNAVLTSDEPINVEASEASPGTWSLSVGHIGLMVTLLSTCRQIHNEARQLFYLNNSFRIICPRSEEGTFSWDYAGHVKRYTAKFLEHANVQQTMTLQMLTVSVGACYGEDALSYSDDFIKAFEDLTALAGQYHGWTIYGRIVLQVYCELEVFDDTADIEVRVDLRNPSQSIIDAIEALRIYMEAGLTTQAGIKAKAHELYVFDLVEGIQFLDSLHQTLVHGRAST